MRECVSTCATVYEISPTISGWSPRTRRIGHANDTKGSHGTYSEGYSLDGADRVAAIARITGAAQYLMTIHGITRVAHTRETLDHRPAARFAVLFAAVTSLYPELTSTSTSRRRTVFGLVKLEDSTNRRKTRHAPQIDVTRWSSCRDAAIFKSTSTRATSPCLSGGCAGGWLTGRPPSWRRLPERTNGTNDRAESSARAYCKFAYRYAGRRWRL